MLRSAGARLRAGILTLVLTASLTALASPGTATAATPTERYGVTDSYLSTADPAAQRLALGVLHGGGVRLVRTDMGWAQVEPAAPGPDGVHHYDWTAKDKWIGTLAQAGMRAYPLVGYAAPWASVAGVWNSRPRDPAQFATYAAAVVTRYGPTGTFWNEHPELPRLPIQSVEIWNEQNAERFWKEQETAPRDYAHLYAASRQAVKAVAPNIEVVVGGLVIRGAEAFVRGMLTAVPALAGNVDAVGYHGYLATPTDLLSRITAFRKTLDSIGLAKAEIAMTEVGWSELEMNDEQRGANLAQISRLTADPALKVTRLISFAAMANEGDRTLWDQWFGLINHDGTPKATFVRWAAEIAALATPVAAPVVPKVIPRTAPAAAKARSPRVWVSAHGVRMSGRVTTAKKATVKRKATPRKKAATSRAKKRATSATKRTLWTAR